MLGRWQPPAAALLLALLLSLVRPVHAQSPPATLAAPVLVSSGAPLAPGCEAAASPTGKVFSGGVVEPSIAVDPHDPGHLVGVWQQDRRSDGGAQGQRAAVSRDGGKTWNLSAAPFTHCQGGNAQNGGDYERASDPWVVFGADGAVYQSALLLNLTTLTSAMGVSRSSDGGQSWSEVTPLIVDDAGSDFNDKETLTADPNDAGIVYATWDRIKKAQRASSFDEIESFDPGDSGPAMFTRTTDGGRTWETAREVFDPGRGAQTVGAQVLVLPGGDLLEVFTLVRLGAAARNAGEKRWSVLAMRSTDRGQRWSDPVAIAESDMPVGDLAEPLTGMPLRSGAGQLVNYAVDPAGGTVYAVWSDLDPANTNHLILEMAMSGDGGRSWTSPARIDQTPNNAPAFAPAVAVLPDGTVGVSYYDLRNDSPSEAAIATDYWLESCRRGCTQGGNWSEMHIAGPFDLRPAPFAGGLFLGDYEGLASGSGGFALLFAQTHSSLAGRPTDIYFASAAP